MADFKLNPFDGEDDDIESNVVKIIEPARTVELEITDPVGLKTAASTELNLDAIATRLINERFYLTALELHIELIESGRELAKLRDFFSNPANFERVSGNRNQLGDGSPPRLARAPSIQTFDSLDFARYSDDGERNENDRVAVLEFELRNAHDTIRSLRAALTKAAAIEQPIHEETDASTLNVTSVDEPARPYERRALNFLVNEYLLRHDYKLTSVTFSEENAGQDFDDWDDVGINIAKPPDLLQMYRSHGLKGGGELTLEMCTVGTSTDETDVSVCSKEEHTDLQSRLSHLEDQIKQLERENAKLSATMLELEQDGDGQRLEYVGSTPAVSPIRGYEQKVNGTDNVDGGGLEADVGFKEETEHFENSMEAAGDNAYQTAVCDLSMDESTVEATHNSHDAVGASSEQVETVLSTPSTLQPDTNMSGISEVPSKCQRRTSTAFQQALLESVFHVLSDSRIFGEVSYIAELHDGANVEVVPLLARCLPHVVPNVLLASRDELIPLIVCAAALHQDSEKRDQLLNILFNLIKRPDADQRRMILIGCVAFARHAGAARVESELLPQCWEQIAHRYVERRLLVAEACGALAPHVPAELRGSLLFSMLQQMLEDKTEDVREAAVKSLGVLTGFIDDSDKLPALKSLLFNIIRDSSDRVLAALKWTFLPSLAVWSMEIGRLETDLLTAFLERIEKLLESCRATNIPSTVSGVIIADPKHFGLLVDILCLLMPIVYASFLNSAPFATENGHLTDIKEQVSAAFILPKPASGLLDVSLVLGGNERLAQLVCQYETYVNEEWFHPWPAYTWVSGDLVSQIVSVAQAMDAGDQSMVHMLSIFFRSLCYTFGRAFVSSRVRPQFQKVLQFPAANVIDMSLIEHASLLRCTAPVYAAGVLAAFSSDEDHAELTKFLHEFICSAAVHRCSLIGVTAAVQELCSADEASTGIPDLLLSVLWECIVSPLVLIRAAAARTFEATVRAGGVQEALMATRVVPALVTLAGDSNADVRASTVAAFGAMIECVSSRAILDKVYMQLQSLMDDPAYRDEHLLRVSLIRALGRAGPSAEQRFRDDFILPRLTALAVQNSAAATDTSSRRTDITMALFDAYCSVSCCFIGEQLISEVFLPGLKCLHRDILQLIPENASVIASMIREFEDRVDVSAGGPASGIVRPASANNGGSTALSPVTSAAVTPEGIKVKMMSHIKDVKERASHSNLSKIFNASKK